MSRILTFSETVRTALKPWWRWASESQFSEKQARGFVEPDFDILRNSKNGIETLVEMGERIAVLRKK